MRINVIGESQFNDEILTSDALAFVLALHDKFNPKRLELLYVRKGRQLQFDRGERPNFLDATREIRDGDWKVTAAPQDLSGRRCEITGPPVPDKMLVNGLNSGADGIMICFEDALSPTWGNLMWGQHNAIRAANLTLKFQAPGADGKLYEINDNPATLMMRPRGLHFPEKNVEIDGKPVSGAFLDYALYIFHCGKTLIERGSGPYFYIPKLEHYLEARLWANIFAWSVERLSLKPGKLCVTVLIETIPAAFQMSEILYELRDFSCALNAGRWDYIFSMIKKFGTHLPDRVKVTMASHFLRSYALLLIKTCHKHGARAIGGMSAAVPNRNDTLANEIAIAKVRSDKKREFDDGSDGGWFAHPDLVPVGIEVYDSIVSGGAAQLDKIPDVEVFQGDLLAPVGGVITRAGIMTNIVAPLQYMANWLSGTGCVPIDGSMEDGATVEISFAETWLWIKDQLQLNDGSPITIKLFRELLAEAKVVVEPRLKPAAAGKLDLALRIFDTCMAQDEPVEFLLLKMYEHLE